MLKEILDTKQIKELMKGIKNAIEIDILETDLLFVENDKEKKSILNKIQRREDKAELFIKEYYLAHVGHKVTSNLIFNGKLNGVNFSSKEVCDVIVCRYDYELCMEINVMDMVK